MRPLTPVQRQRLLAGAPKAPPADGGELLALCDSLGVHPQQLSYFVQQQARRGGHSPPPHLPRPSPLDSHGWQPFNAPRPFFPRFALSRLPHILIRRPSSATLIWRACPP
eukprot:4435828-Prymnesium_polylepis.1